MYRIHKARKFMKRLTVEDKTHVCCVQHWPSLHSLWGSFDLPLLPSFSQYTLKLAASDLFKGQKDAYPASVARPFLTTHLCRFLHIYTCTSSCMCVLHGCTIMYGCTIIAVCMRVYTTMVHVVCMCVYTCTVMAFVHTCYSSRRFAFEAEQLQFQGAWCWWRQGIYTQHTSDSQSTGGASRCYPHSSLQDVSSTTVMDTSPDRGCSLSRKKYVHACLNNSCIWTITSMRWWERQQQHNRKAKQRNTTRLKQSFFKKKIGCLRLMQVA